MLKSIDLSRPSRSGIATFPQTGPDERLLGGINTKSLPRSYSIGRDVTVFPCMRVAVGEWDRETPREIIHPRSAKHRLLL